MDNFLKSIHPINKKNKGFGYGVIESRYSESPARSYPDMLESSFSKTNSPLISYRKVMKVIRHQSTRNVIGISLGCK
jgi:hypothetical protein